MCRWAFGVVFVWARTRPKTQMHHNKSKKELEIYGWAWESSPIIGQRAQVRDTVPGVYNNFYFSGNLIKVEYIKCNNKIWVTVRVIEPSKFLVVTFLRTG